MRNVLTDPGFPNSYGRSHTRVDRKNAITVREALLKLEKELHRVTKQSGTITLFHTNTPSVFTRDSEGEEGKSRLQHVQEIFGVRWKIEMVPAPKGFEMRAGDCYKITKRHLVKRA